MLFWSVIELKQPEKYTLLGFLIIMKSRRVLTSSMWGLVQDGAANRP